MAFLGRAADGERLFQKAIRLNPYRNLWYYQYGSLAYFVQRKFLMSTEMALKRQLVNVWVDLPGYIAAAYAQHIKDLQEEIDDAEECNDIGRGDRLRLELEQLRDHLSQSLGIGGRPRKLKSTAERARAAVTLRIRGTIKKIAALHPSLGKHLSNSIRTGVFCSYSPEDSRDWILH